MKNLKRTLCMTLCLMLMLACIPAMAASPVKIGVLVADNPYGPYKDPLGQPLVWQKEHWDDIDPTVWIDDDGQAYMYWGNPNFEGRQRHPRPLLCVRGQCHAEEEPLQLRLVGGEIA